MQAMHRPTDVIRRQLLALATERGCRSRLRRRCEYLKRLTFHLASEQKPQRFLTALAKNFVAASTQNQGFNAIIFFYEEASGVELKKSPGLAGQKAGLDSPRPTPTETNRDQTFLVLSDLLVRIRPADE